MTQEDFFKRYKYSIRTDKVGGGAFGTVYKAFDEELNREVAIKVSEVKIMGGKEFSLKDEFDAIKDVPVQRNIANYEELFTFEGPQGIFDYAVMQFYKDGNLSSFIKGNPTLAQKEQVALDLLEGIHHLHKHSVVHRDLKPGNILIVKRGDKTIPVITDFGLSKNAKTEGQSRFSNSFGGGTLKYSSPEQLKAEKLRLNTDLWAYGVIVYEIFTGKNLFMAQQITGASAEAEKEIYEQIIGVDVSEMIKELPSKWQDVVKQCLVRDGAKRIKSTQALKDLILKDETFTESAASTNDDKTLISEVVSEQSMNAQTIVNDKQPTQKKAVKKEPTQQKAPPKKQVESKYAMVLQEEKAQKKKMLVGGGIALVAIACFVLFVLKPWETNIDPVILKQFTSLKTEADSLANENKWSDALVKYKAANKLIANAVLKDSVASLTNKIKEQAVTEENTSWKNAKKTNTIQGYKSYKASYAKGIYAKSVDSAIAKLEAYLKSEVGRKKIAADKAAAKKKILELQKQKELAKAKERLKNLAPSIQSLVNSFVYVQGGTFRMGCTGVQSNCFDSEKPVHSVTVNSFNMGKYEITLAQWEEIMGNYSSWYEACSNCPVKRVRWDDIKQFIKKLEVLTGNRYRLPTEAEWEFAARGGRKSIGYEYSGSNNISSVAWYDDNRANTEHAVGQKQSNELGLFDMSGNVSEWCSDWYGADYYSGSPSSNPKGPSSGQRRVTRGGSSGFSYRSSRVSSRGSQDPLNRNHSIGFRLVSY
jgi:formylglycine-generating enzyme required for sulfatase activity